MKSSRYKQQILLPRKRRAYQELFVLTLLLVWLINSIPNVIAYDRQTYFPLDQSREIDLDPYEATSNRPQEWKITQIYTDDIGREYVLIGKRECEELVWLKEKYRCERGSYKVFLSDFNLLGK